MSLDEEACYRALAARDQRFDGLFFVGVTTTGIYCRPVCPARTPGRSRCRFFHRGAQAEREGFRACFRCRPELAPGSAPIDAVSRLVAGAARRIEAGALDGAPLGELAAELGVTPRHLRRAMKRELGVTPVALAQSCRLALAKQLLQDTSLPIARVAYASGFSSVRRFNALFRSRFDRSPSDVRRGSSADVGLEIGLGYRAPFAWSELLSFLALRAVPGVAAIEDQRYRRSVRIDAREGWIEARLEESNRTVRVTLSASLMPCLPDVAARLRRLFDLDARPTEVAAHLARDAALRPVLRATPGLRVPGAFDPFELTLRAVLGQQVTVKGATTLAGRLAAAFGEPVAAPWPELSLLSPTAAALAGATEAAVRAVGLPAARARTIITVATAFAEGRLSLRPGDDPRTAIAELESLHGVGPWTAQYVAMRALAEPDAFPSSDLGLRRALDDISARDLRERAESWRPWRAYAAVALWQRLSGGYE